MPKEIIDAARSGNPVFAMEYLVAEYETKLRAAAMRQLNHMSDVEDAVQEAYIATYPKLGAFIGCKGPGPDMLESYLFSSLRYICWDLNGGKKPVVDPSSLPIPSTEVPELDKIVDDELRCRLNECVNRQPKRSQAIINLRFEQDLSWEEIAEILKTTIPTVKNELQYTKRRIGYCMRKWLQENASSHFC
jgi:RNA polymerase sigma factor (sigma-70 family)